MWTQIVPKTKEIDVDILGFWKTQEPNLSLLSRLAKRVLAIPVSSTSSELVISESGRVVAASQTLQNSDKAEKLIWIQQNHGTFLFSVYFLAIVCLEMMYSVFSTNRSGSLFPYYEAFSGSSLQEQLVVESENVGSAQLLRKRRVALLKLM